MADNEDGIVVISGKEYITVAKRLADFRERHPDWSITTKLLEAAELVRVKATIKDDIGRVIATGYSEENREQGNINKTSAVENAETSAVGRALAFLGLGGTHIRSADEMQAAVDAQKEMAGVERLKRHNEALRENLESVVAIKHYLLNDEYSGAYEAYAELDQDAWQSLWMAPSNGGIWTTKERGQFKSNEWNDARKAHHDITDEDEA